MPKIFLLFFTILLISSNIFSDEHDNTVSVFSPLNFKAKIEDVKKMLIRLGYYGGNPNENIIIVGGNNFLVIHNPTLMALTVTKFGATNYCKESFSSDKYVANFMFPLGKFTMYYSCEEINKLDKYNLSEKEINCISNKDFEEVIDTDCANLNIKNIKIIEEINKLIMNENKYKTREFIFSIRSKYYNKIQELEFLGNKQLISDINRVIIEEKINYMEQFIEGNKKICNSYGFIIGTEQFGECILQLLSLESLD